MNSTVDAKRLLEKHLDTMESARAVDKRAIETVTASLSETQTELAKRCEDVARLDAELAALHHQKQRGLPTDSVEAMDALNTRAALQECQSKLTQLNECLRVAETSRAEKVDEISRLKQKLTEVTQLQQTLEDRNVEVKELKSALLHQIDINERSSEELKRRLAENESVIGALKSENSKMDTQYWRVASEKAAIENELQKRKANMEGLAEDMELLIAEQDRTRVLELRVLAENTTLASQVNALQEERHRLVNQCSELQDAINAMNAEKFEAVKHQNPNQKIQVGDYSQLYAHHLGVAGRAEDVAVFLYTLF